MGRESHPTEFELEILKVLWRLGPSTTRQVLDVMRSDRDLGYTTIMKMLQIMESKGFVSVDRSLRTHTYAARISRTSTLQQLAEEFVHRTFDGAVDELLVHLVDTDDLRPDELKRLSEKLVAMRQRREKHGMDAPTFRPGTDVGEGQSP